MTIDVPDLRAKPRYDAEIAALVAHGLKPYKVWRVLVQRHGQLHITQRTVYRKAKKLFLERARREADKRFKP